MASIIANEMPLDSMKAAAVEVTAVGSTTGSSSASISESEVESSQSSDNESLKRVHQQLEIFPVLPTSVYQPWASSHSVVQSVDISQSTQANATASLIGAWAVLLGRYSALTTDVVFGVSSEATSSVRAVRVTWDAGMKSATLLELVQNKIDNKDEAPFDTTLRTAVVISTNENQPIPQQHALVLTILYTTPTKIRVSARFDQNLLDTRQVDRIVHQFSHILLQLFQSQECTIDDLDLCPPEDRAEIAQWNPPMPAAAETTIHEMVQQTCRQRWNELAVQAWDGDLTYGEVDTASTKLAHHLRSKFHIGRGSCVPLTFDRSKFVPITQLAVLKAGAAYIGTEPSQPITRLEKIFTQVDAKCILSSPNWVSKMSGSVEKVVSIDQDLLDSLPEQEEQLPAVDPQSTAVVIFTSGSTGTPKGIVMRHTDLASAIVAHSAGMKIPERTRILQFSSFNFDHSIYEIMTALIGGCIVCVPTEEQRMNDLAGVMREMRIQYLYATPTVAKLLTPSEVPDLDTLYLGGEAISQNRLDLWIADKRVIAGYGPTEAGMCGFSEFTAGDVASTIHVSQGGMNWVVDPNDYNKLVPIGTPGELLQEGPMVAAGYLNNPSATAQAFVDPPSFRQNSTSRFYKSGDLAQYNADGTFKFIARIDTQVKIRGQRVELEEVEDHLQPLVSPDQAFCVDVVRLQGATSDALAVFLAPEEPQETNNVDEVSLAAQDDVSRWQKLTMRIESEMAKTLPVYLSLIHI